MKPHIRPIAVFAMLLFVVPLFGCEIQRIAVHIMDFETKQVEGLTIWRAESGSDTFRRDCTVHFTDIGTFGGVEKIRYSTVYNGREAHWWDPIERSAENPDEVIVRVYVPVTVRGEYKVSTFNPAGESELSDASLLL